MEAGALAVGDTSVMRPAAAGIDPQGLEALAVVVDVVFVQLCGAGDLIVAVDAGRDEGQYCALRSHEGTFQAAEQDGGAVHLTIAHGKAQGRAVG